MIQSILAFLLGGGLITLIVDGAKRLSAGYDRARGAWKHALVWGSALLFVLLLRGFDLPETALGWTYFVVSIAVLALVAYGWFRLKQHALGLYYPPSDAELVMPFKPAASVDAYGKSAGGEPGRIT